MALQIKEIKLILYKLFQRVEKKKQNKDILQSRNSTPRYTTNVCIRKHTCKRMFIAMLFVITPNWKDSICLCREECTSEL